VNVNDERREFLQEGEQKSEQRGGSGHREIRTDSLFSILVIIGEKSCKVGFVVPRGRPRYVNGIVPTAHPKVLARCEVLD